MNYNIRFFLMKATLPVQLSKNKVREAEIIRHASSLFQVTLNISKEGNGFLIMAIQYVISQYFLPLIGDMECFHQELKNTLLKSKERVILFCSPSQFARLHNFSLLCMWGISAYPGHQNCFVYLAQRGPGPYSLELL